MLQDPFVARLSSATLYATRALIEIARAENCLVTSSVIQARQRVPGKFLDQLLARLRRAGLVVSVRGPRGGYALRRSPHSTSLADIVAAVCGADPQPDLTTMQLVEGAWCRGLRRPGVLEAGYRSDARGHGWDHAQHVGGASGGTRR